MKKNGRKEEMAYKCVTNLSNNMSVYVAVHKETGHRLMRILSKYGRSRDGFITCRTTITVTGDHYFADTEFCSGCGYDLEECNLGALSYRNRKEIALTLWGTETYPTTESSTSWIKLFRTTTTCYFTQIF